MATLSTERTLGRKILEQPLVAEGLEAMAGARYYTDTWRVALTLVEHGLREHGFLTFDSSRGWVAGPALEEWRAQDVEAPIGNVVAFRGRS